MTHLSVADVDDIAFRLECGVKVLFSIHIELESGDSHAKDVAPAVYGAYDHLSMLVKELRQLLDGNPEGENVTT